MGARRIFFRGGQIRGSGDERLPAGFRVEPEFLGAKPPEADEKL